MSKQHSNQLFHLIQAMNGSEKRYFKRYIQIHGGKHTHTGRLFDAYRRQKNPDEKALVRSEKYLSGFAQHKQHLFVMVMRSLRAYHTGATREAQVHALLADAAILRQMRQYETGLSVLKKAMRIARNTGNALQQLDILKKMDEMRFDGRLPIPSRESAEVLREEEMLLSQYTELALNKSLAKAMYSAHQHDRSESQLLKQLSGRAQKQPKGFLAARFYLTSQTAHAFLTKDLAAALRYATDHVQLLESDPDYIDDYPHEYMKVLSSRLVLEDVCGLHERCLATIAAIRQLHSAPRIARKLKMFLSHTFVYTYTAEINALVRSVRFEEAVALIPFISKGMSKHSDSISPAEAKVFFLNFSLIYLYAGNAKAAFRWSGKALDETPDERKDLNYTLQVVRLLSTYDKNDLPFLQRLIRKHTPELSADSTVPRKATASLLEFLRVLAAEENPKQRRELILAFRDRLLSKSMRKEMEALNQQVEILAWLNAKLERKTTADVLRGAALQKKM